MPMDGNRDDVNFDELLERLQAVYGSMRSRITALESEVLAAHGGHREVVFSTPPLGAQCSVEDKERNSNLRPSSRSESQRSVRSSFEVWRKAKRESDRRSCRKTKPPGSVRDPRGMSGKFRVQQTSDNLTSVKLSHAIARSSVGSFVPRDLSCGEEGRDWRTKAQALVKSRAFDNIVGIVILANTVYIGIETDRRAKTLELSNSVDSVVQSFFNIFYLVELVARLSVHGRTFFTNRDWSWAWADFILGLSAAVDLVATLVFGSSALGVSGLRGIRLVRLLRAIRLIRTLKSVREFQKMAYAFVSSGKTLFCSLLFLSFVMYFFAVILTQAATEQKLGAAAAPVDSEGPDESLDEYFGSLGKSFFSLFMGASNGLSWYNLYQPIQQAHWSAPPLFLIYISIVLFGVLNVVTSIFVESAITSTQYYKDLIIQEKQREREVTVTHMEEVFRQMDEDGSGLISSDEMEYFLSDAGLRRYVEALNISADDTRMLFNLLDRDGSNEIDINEFCQGCLRLQGQAKSFDIHALIYRIEQFLSKWSDFTCYVEEKLEDLPFEQAVSQRSETEDI